MLVAGTQEFLLFTLILMRMSGFIFLNPILGRKNIPALAKTGMTLVLTLMIYPVSSITTEVTVTSAFTYGILLLMEFGLGYLLGFVMQLFEMVVTYAGTVMDFQMGLSMATVYDPQNGAQIALTGNILQVYYLLLFFAVDGHLALMKILVTSGDIVPYAQIAFGKSTVDAIISIFCECVLLAVKLSMPIIAFEFIMEISVGILMKIIPQINLFVLSIQLRIIVGFVMLLVLISPIGQLFGGIITDMINTLQDILKSVAG